MNRGRRTIRLAKWAGVGLCVLIITAWAVSMRWSFGFDASLRVTTGIEWGVLVVVWSDAPATGFAWILQRAQPRQLTPMVAIDRVMSVAFIPLWLPLILLAPPTYWLFRLDRRKPRPGFCACGYDLTGNVSGVCPECGVRVR